MSRLWRTDERRTNGRKVENRAVFCWTRNRNYSEPVMIADKATVVHNLLFWSGHWAMRVRFQNIFCTAVSIVYKSFFLMSKCSALSGRCPQTAVQLNVFKQIFIGFCKQPTDGTDKHLPYYRDGRLCKVFKKSRYWRQRALSFERLNIYESNMLTNTQKCWNILQELILWTILSKL